jgi:hypothetical protein
MPIHDGTPLPRPNRRTPKVWADEVLVHDPDLGPDIARDPGYALPGETFDRPRFDTVAEVLSRLDVESDANAIDVQALRDEVAALAAQVAALADAVAARLAQHPDHGL